jgi:hypothetical protein
MPGFLQLLELAAIVCGALFAASIGAGIGAFIFLCAIGAIQL